MTLLFGSNSLSAKDKAPTAPPPPPPPVKPIEPHST